MRLKSVIPGLSSFHRLSAAYENLGDALETLDITTLDDLVLRDSFEELNQRLLGAKVDCSHLSRLYHEILATLATHSTLGNESYAKEMERRSSLGEPLKTGAISVDSVLRLPPYGIVEVAGLPSTGKTLLVKQIILKYLIANPMAAANWIDSLGNFSPERASRVSMELRLREAAQLDPLTRLHVATCTDLASVYDVLDEITKLIEDPGDYKARTRLVIIDPITPLLGPSLTNESSKGHAHMVTFMRHLASMSRSHGLTFFLVNTATKVTPPVQPGKTPPPVTYKPSLGPSYSYLTDISLFLSRIPPSSQSDVKGEFKVKVLKYRNTDASMACHFRIDNCGLII